jgi:hypothetical protein
MNIGDLGSPEIGAIVAGCLIIVGFVYWRIGRSRKGKDED